MIIDGKKEAAVLRDKIKKAGVYPLNKSTDRYAFEVSIN